MTATTIERNTEFAGLVPSKGTGPVAASTLLLKGTIAVGDTSGNINVPGANRDAFGKVAATYDNRTGIAGAIDAEIEFGVFGWAFTGTTPKAEDILYVVDNQTVSVDSNGGTRGIAGFCTEVRDGKAFTWMGPHVSGTIQIGSDVESVADAADAAVTRLKVIDVPVSLATLRVNDGSAVPAFSNGVADGFALVDSKAVGLRINNGSTTVFMGSVKLPTDLDITQPVTMHFRGNRIGSADPTAALTVHAWAQHDGAAHDAGADLTNGATTAFAAATKVDSNVTRAITAPAAGDTLSFTFVATAALAADDLLLESCWISCTRVIA